MRVAVPLALVVCAVAGCGIGSTDTVEEIRPEELAALDQTSTTTTTLPPVETTVETVPPTVDTAPPPSGPVESVPPSAPETTLVEPTELAWLYFVSGSEIVPVETPVRAPARERRIIDALGAGPPPREFEAGVRTAVPPDLVNSLRKGPPGNVITVDLDGELFHGIDSEDQRYVVAQIVLTLTRLPGIDNVLFTINREPLRVFQRNNELTEPGEPVSCEDYEELLAEGSCSG